VVREACRQLGTVANDLPQRKHAAAVAHGRRDEELKKYLEGMEGRIKAELTEVMRDMQTELLRGFEAFSAGQVLRVRKLEAGPVEPGHRSLGRVDVLERRLLQIELKLGGKPL